MQNRENKFKKPSSVNYINKKKSGYWGNVTALKRKSTKYLICRNCTVIKMY